MTRGGGAFFGKNCPSPSRALPHPEKTFALTGMAGPRRCPGETVTSCCPRQMGHRICASQPSVIRHQEHPASIQDLRTRPRLLPEIGTIPGADGSPFRTVAPNSLKSIIKTTGNRMAIPFPVVQRFPALQNSPHEQRRRPAAGSSPSSSPALSSSLIKVFGKDGGSLRGEGRTFFQKGFPCPPHPKLFPLSTRSSRNAWSSPRKAGRARARPERRGNP